MHYGILQQVGGRLRTRHSFPEAKSLLQLQPVLSILLPLSYTFCSCWVHSDPTISKDKWEGEG